MFVCDNEFRILYHEIFLLTSVAAIELLIYL